MRKLLLLLVALPSFFGAAQAQTAGDYLVPKQQDGMYLGSPIERFDNLGSNDVGMRSEDAKRAIQSCYDYAWSRYNFDRVDKYGQATQFRIIHLSNVFFKNNPFFGTIREYEYGGHPYLIMRMGVQRRNGNGQPLSNGTITVFHCVFDRYSFGDTNKVIGFEKK